MSQQGLEVIETSTQKTHEWIARVAEAAHLEKHDSYKCLRSVLQTLRDRLPVEDAVHFAAGLPIFLRGVFYDGWEPSKVPMKMSVDEFLQAVKERIVTGHFVDPLRITECVLRVVADHIAGGEMDKLKHRMPKDIQALWPEPVPLL